MTKYKAVIGPAAMQISKDQTYQEAVNQYADLISSEATDGWEFITSIDIPVHKSLTSGCLDGCLATLLKRPTYETVNVVTLIFAKKN